MKKKSIFLFIILFVATGLGVYSINGLFSDTTYTSESIFSVGNISYTWNGSISSDVKVPGEELITTPYTLTNSSTISSKLRIKLNYIYNSTETVMSNALTDLIVFTLSDDWIYNNEDGYYYYNTLIAPTMTTINVISSLKLNGNVVDNNYSGSSIRINVFFEACQNINWDELGSIDFETGLPK